MKKHRIANKEKEFIPYEYCDSCLFESLCKGVDLPNCEGLDYVKDRNKEENK